MLRSLRCIAVSAAVLAACAVDDAHPLDGRDFRVVHRYRGGPEKATVLRFADGRIRPLRSYANESGEYRCEPVDGGWRFNATIRRILNTQDGGIGAFISLKRLGAFVGGGVGATAAASGRCGPRAGAEIVDVYEGTVIGDTIDGCQTGTVDGVTDGSTMTFSGKAQPVPDKPIPIVLWSYRMWDEHGDTVLDLDGVRLVFTGHSTSGSGSGTMTASSPEPDSGSGQSGSGGDVFVDHAHDGRCDVSYAGRQLVFTDGATRLTVDGGAPIPLDHGRPTILIPRKGDPRVAGVEKPPKPGLFDGRSYRIDVLVNGSELHDTMVFVGGGARFGAADSVRFTYATQPGHGTATAWTASGEEPAAGDDGGVESRLSAKVSGTIDGDVIAGAGSYSVGGSTLASFTFTGTRIADDR